MNERTDGPLLVRHDDTTAVFTLNRPEQRNAFDVGTLRVLREAIAEARAAYAIGASPSVLSAAKAHAIGSAIPRPPDHRSVCVAPTAPTTTAIRRESIGAGALGVRSRRSASEASTGGRGADA